MAASTRRRPRRGWVALLSSRLAAVIGRPPDPTHAPFRRVVQSNFHVVLLLHGGFLRERCPAPDALLGRGAPTGSANSAAPSADRGPLGWRTSARQRSTGGLVYCDAWCAR